MSKHSKLDELFLEAIHSVEDDMGVPFNQYIRDVLEESKKEITRRPTWGQGQGTIYNSLDMALRQNSGSIYTGAPHGYLRQWGETASGATEIRPVNAKKLLINKTGLSLDEFKDIPKDELKRRFVYGVDYYFANMVRIMSNPYLAIPELDEYARNKTPGYKDNDANAEKVLDVLKNAIVSLVGKAFRRLRYEKRL